MNKESSGVENECKEGNNFQYILRVADNGRGTPEEIDFRASNSLGFQLINLLVEQIDGCVELRRDQGTEFTIRFSKIQNEPVKLINRIYTKPNAQAIRKYKIVCLV